MPHSIQKQRVRVPEIRIFNMADFMGKWYEIARIDNRFEKGLSMVTVEYKESEEGHITVINRGYDLFKKMWKEKRGKVLQSEKKNYLKMHFFPFITSKINVAYFDATYNVALLLGNSGRHLWILSRKRHIPNKELNQMLTIAKDMGYDTSEMIYTIQE